MRRTILALLAALALSGPAVLPAPAADDGARRAEAAADRAEAAAERSESAARRVEEAAARLERLVDRLEQADAAKTRNPPAR